jgi:hypothetical protein
MVYGLVVGWYLHIDDRSGNSRDKTALSGSFEVGILAA